MRIVSAIEAHHVVILVFNPDAPQKPSGRGVLFRLNIDHEAAHFAQKLATHEVEVVIFLLKIGIEDHHLREAKRQETHGIQAG